MVVIMPAIMMIVAASISCAEGLQMDVKSEKSSLETSSSYSSATRSSPEEESEIERISQPVSVGGSYLTCFQTQKDVFNDVSCMLADSEGNKADLRKKDVKQILVQTDNKPEAFTPKIAWHKDEEPQHFSFLAEISLGQISNVEIEGFDGKRFKSKKPEIRQMQLNQSVNLFSDSFDYENPTENCNFAPCYYRYDTDWNMSWVENACPIQPKLELWNQNGETWAELYSSCQGNDASLSLTRIIEIKAGSTYKIGIEFGANRSTAHLIVKLNEELLLDSNQIPTNKWTHLVKVFKAEKTEAIKLIITDKTPTNAFEKGSLLKNVNIEEL